MSRNAVFIAVNRRFFPYAAVFLRSLVQNYPQYPDLLAFHTDLTPEEEARLSRFPRVKPVRCRPEDIEIGPAMASLDLRYADPSVSYLRFLIWTDALKEYDRVLHLDTDVLVLGPLDEIFEEEGFVIFTETYRGDCPVFRDHRDPEVLRLLREDGIDLPATPANFGVFLAPREFRTPEDRALILHLMRRYERHIQWADQSIINLWLAKKRIAIRPDRRFNFQHRLVERGSGWAKEARQARIFHFNGVEPVFRLPLMHCARRLFGFPGGYALYTALYRTLRGLLLFLRAAKRAGTAPAG